MHREGHASLAIIEQFPSEQAAPVCPGSTSKRTVGLAATARASRRRKAPIPHRCQNRPSLGGLSRLRHKGRNCHTTFRLPFRKLAISAKRQASAEERPALTQCLGQPSKNADCSEMNS